MIFDEQSLSFCKGEYFITTTAIKMVFRTTNTNSLYMPFVLNRKRFESNKLRDYIYPVIIHQV